MSLKFVSVETEGMESDDSQCLLYSFMGYISTSARTEPKRVDWKIQTTTSFVSTAYELQCSFTHDHTF